VRFDLKWEKLVAAAPGGGPLQFPLELQLTTSKPP